MALAVGLHSIARLCSNDQFVTSSSVNINNNNDGNGEYSVRGRWSREEDEPIKATVSQSARKTAAICNGEIVDERESPAKIKGSNESGKEFAAFTVKTEVIEQSVLTTVKTEPPSCPDSTAALPDCSRRDGMFPVTLASADSGESAVRPEERHADDVSDNLQDHITDHVTDIEPVLPSTRCHSEVVSETHEKLQPAVAYRKQKSDIDLNVCRTARCRQKRKRERRTTNSKHIQPSACANNISGYCRWHVLPLDETGFCVSLLPRRGEPEIPTTADDEPKEENDDIGLPPVEITPSGSEPSTALTPNPEHGTDESRLTSDVLCAVASDFMSTLSAEGRPESDDDNNVSSANNEDLSGASSVELHVNCDQSEWIKYCQEASCDYENDDDNDCGKSYGHVTMTTSSSQIRQRGSLPVGLCPTSDKRLRRKSKWRVEKARLQLKSKHCRTVCNSVHGVSLYVNHRVAKRMSLMEIVDPSSMYRKETSFREIDQNKAKPWPRQTSSLKNDSGRTVPTSDDQVPVCARKARGERKLPVASGTGGWVHAADEGNFDSSLSDDLRALLLALQHRDLDPEDYDLLLRLDERVKPKTAETSLLDSLRVEVVTEPEVFFDASAAVDVSDSSTLTAVDQLTSSPSEQPDGYIDADAPLTVCGVCLEQYDVGQRRKYLPCGHAFHADCIDSWLSQSSLNCPLDGLPIVAQ